MVLGGGALAQLPAPGSVLAFSTRCCHHFAADEDFRCFSPGRSCARETSDFCQVGLSAWMEKSVVRHQLLSQESGTYGSRARCGSFDDGIWLSWYFLNTIVTDETFSVIFLQSHQQHHAVPEVAFTVRSMFLKRKFRHLPLFKIVGFA